MSEGTTCFVALRLKQWTIAGFGCLLFLLLHGTMLVGSLGESDPWQGTTPGSLGDQPLLQHSFTSVLPVPLQSPLDTNMTEINIRRKRSSSAVLPPKILTASDLSALRDLVSDKKVTVRLGLRVSLTGPSELLDPQHLLSLYKEPGIYNIGGQAGLFSMRVVGIKKVTSLP